MSRDYERGEREGWRRQQQTRQGQDRWTEGAREDEYGWNRDDDYDRGQQMRGGYQDRGQRGGNWDQQRNDRGWDRGQNRGWEGDYDRNWNQNMGGRGWNQNQQNWNEGWNQQGMRRGNEGEHAGRGPKGYKRTDARIEEDINDRMTQHGMLDASEIEVSVQNGEVTLRGHVDRRDAKRLAEDIAESVFGVKDVNNQIKIKQRDRGDEMKNESESQGNKQKDRKAS